MIEELDASRCCASKLCGHHSMIQISALVLFWFLQFLYVIVLYFLILHSVLYLLIIIIVIIHIIWRFSLNMVHRPPYILKVLIYSFRSDLISIYLLRISLSLIRVEPCLNWILLWLKIGGEIRIVLRTLKISRYLIPRISKWIAFVLGILSIIQVYDCRLLAHKLLFISHILTLLHFVLCVSLIVNILKSGLGVELKWVESAFLLFRKLVERGLLFWEHIIWDWLLLRVRRICLSIYCYWFLVFELDLFKVVVISNLISLFLGRLLWNYFVDWTYSDIRKVKN